MDFDVNMYIDGTLHENYCHVKHLDTYKCASRALRPQPSSNTRASTSASSRSRISTSTFINNIVGRLSNSSTDPLRAFTSTATTRSTTVSLPCCAVAKHMLLKHHMHIHKGVIERTVVKQYSKLPIDLLTQRHPPPLMIEQRALQFVTIKIQTVLALVTWLMPALWQDIICLSHTTRTVYISFMRLYSCQEQTHVTVLENDLQLHQPWAWL
eukprot:1015088-Amphidinium_carterae.1